MSKLVCRNTRALTGATVTRAHLRARPRRSARYGFPTACTSRMHLPQGRPMLHLVCLLLQLGSQDFQLHHHKLLFPLPIMVSATSVVSQVTVLGIAIRTRINWPSQQLAVEATSPATNSAKSYGRVHANHVDLNEVLDQPATVMGTLLVNSVPASVLFDSGASHSFMSEDFAYKHDVKIGRASCRERV